MSKELEQQLMALGRRLDALYLPSPAEALLFRERQTDYTTELEVEALWDPNAANELRGREIWASDPLLTKGFTQIEAFVGLVVRRDNVAPNLGNRQLFTFVLQGTCGSAWVDLAEAIVRSDGRTKKFSVDTLSVVTLSNAVKVVVYLADNASYQEPPAHDRTVLCDIDVLIEAGVTY